MTRIDRSALAGGTAGPRRTVALGLGLLLTVAGCSTAAGGSASQSAGTTSSTSSSSSASSSASGSSPQAKATKPAKPVVLAFAADIADGGPGSAAFATARATGDVVRRIAPRWVIVGGDNAYSSGTLAEYRTRYDPTWGSFKSITKAVPGNHEYRTADAAGYRQYFSKGTSRPYDVFSAGNRWRVYLLNCEIDCAAGSAQERWLRKDLGAHRSDHVLAVVHRPRYSSGKHGDDTRVTALWEALLDAKADVMLSGHDHGYEVFAKQDARGRARPSDGIKEFVNGTGGAEMYPFEKPRPNSRTRLNQDFGVLKLSLRPATYSWQFIASGYCWDDGERSACPSRKGKVLDSGERRTNRQ